MSDLVKSIISGFNENYDNLEKSNIEYFSNKVLKNNIIYNDIILGIDSPFDKNSLEKKIFEYTKINKIKNEKCNSIQLKNIENIENIVDMNFIEDTNFYIKIIIYRKLEIIKKLTILKKLILYYEYLIINISNLQNKINISIKVINDLTKEKDEYKTFINNILLKDDISIIITEIKKIMCLEELNRKFIQKL